MVLSCEATQVLTLLFPQLEVTAVCACKRTGVPEDVVGVQKVPAAVCGAVRAVPGHYLDLVCHLQLSVSTTVDIETRQVFVFG